MSKLTKKYDGVLPMKEEKIFRVTLKDLEQFIQHHTGKHYDIRAGEEASSDTVKQYRAIPEVDSQLLGWKAQDENGTHKLCMILCNLCHQGLLPQGTYSVDMGW